MPLHLIKLAVGCESVKELKRWVAERMKAAKAEGLPQRHIHVTRMTPKRVEDILAGGSLYWVIRGDVASGGCVGGGGGGESKPTVFPGRRHGGFRFAPPTLHFFTTF